MVLQTAAAVSPVPCRVRAAGLWTTECLCFVAHAVVGQDPDDSYGGESFDSAEDFKSSATVDVRVPMPPRYLAMLRDIGSSTPQVDEDAHRADVQARFLAIMAERKRQREEASPSFSVIPQFYFRKVCGCRGVAAWRPWSVTHFLVL